MGESIKRIVGPYQDSYSPNGIIGGERCVWEWVS